MSKKKYTKKDPTANDAVGEADRTDRRPSEEVRLAAIAANNERAKRIREALGKAE